MSDENGAVKDEPAHGLPTTSKIKDVGSDIGIAPTEYLESSTQCDAMDSKDNASIGTQVDIRSLVSESELNKEESAEIFWQKMAEQSKAALEEARDENKKLHITIDFLARKNVEYQQIIDDYQRNAREAAYQERHFNARGAAYNQERHFNVGEVAYNQEMQLNAREVGYNQERNFNAREAAYNQERHFNAREAGYNHERNARGAAYNQERHARGVAYNQEGNVNEAPNNENFRFRHLWNEMANSMNRNDNTMSL